MVGMILGDPRMRLEPGRTESQVEPGLKWPHRRPRREGLQSEDSVLLDGAGTGPDGDELHGGK